MFPNASFLPPIQTLAWLLKTFICFPGIKNQSKTWKSAVKHSIWIPTPTDFSTKAILFYPLKACRKCDYMKLVKQGTNINMASFMKRWNDAMCCRNFAVFCQSLIWYGVSVNNFKQKIFCLLLHFLMDNMFEAKFLRIVVTNNNCWSHGS